MPTRCSPKEHGQRGYAYMEALVSAVLVAVLLVPALQALQSGVAGAATATAASKQLRLRAKMEEVLATPFAKLYAETYMPGSNTVTSVSAAYSDPAGTADRRVVVLYRYDAASRALSANDTGLLFVGVQHEGEASVHALNTLAGRWW